MACCVDAALFILDIAEAVEEISGEGAVGVLVFLGQIAVFRNLFGDFLPDSFRLAALLEVQVVNVSQAAEAMRAPTGRFADLGVQLVSDQVLEAEVFAEAVGPLQVGAKIAADDNNRPAQLLVPRD